MQLECIMWGMFLMRTRWAALLPRLLFGVLFGMPVLPVVAADEAVPAFLPAEQAFVMSATYDGGDLIRLNWDIAPGCYLYEHRFAVQTEAGAVLNQRPLAPGIEKVDPYFGKVTAYYRTAPRAVQVDRLPSGAQATLLVRYQGCAEAGICYPPDQRSIQLTSGVPGLAILQDDAGAPPATLASRLQSGVASPAITTTALSSLSATLSASPSPSASAVADPGPDPATRLFGLLKEGHLFVILAVFFIAGLGLALTPCVLPMVPILSALVIGSSQKGTRHAATLSGAYVLGMAFVYTGLGALMGLFGARFNVQAALQQPWLLMIFAALFVALAMAMFGFYELRLPASWQSRIDQLARRQSGGLFGVAVVGALSALIVSPCISAPLAGALVYISTYQDAALGGAALFSLALGMGVPLLLFGMGAGTLVPRAGAWMEQVKIGAGITLLGLAIWLLARWLESFYSGLLWGALAVGTAVWLSRITVTHFWIQTTLRLLALALFVYAIVLIAAATTMRTADPVHSTTTMRFTPLSRLDQLPLQLARLKQPALLYISADWCVSCRILEQNVFARADVRARLAGLNLLKADVTDNTPDQKALLEHFSLFGPPAVLFFDRQGTEHKGLRLQGEFTATPFLNRLNVLTPTPNRPLGIKK